MSVRDTFSTLGLTVLERGWLSSNNIVFGAGRETPGSVVDTGYVTHAAQTCSLVAGVLGAVPLGRVLNTHLHSDHCGGNAALQAAWGCRVEVPEASFDAVVHWDERQLTFGLTGQRCDRFSAQGCLRADAVVVLADREWVVVAAPGHDPDAVMLFEPASRVLISADALWEERLAINFPELLGEPGFDAARAALDTVERLAPRIVIPGHGSPFTEVSRALQRSRERLDLFEADPSKHRNYAERALTMFHMLEHQVRERPLLEAWLVDTPIFRHIGTVLDLSAEQQRDRAAGVVSRLLADHLLKQLPDGRLGVV
jgi:glyoxylase-like metal-dependent hydrolase (beta-lactamase superfamily II)